MCSPYRPDNSANYRIRKRVPAELQKFFGKTQIVRSLKTADTREARRRAPLVCAEIDKIFSDARRSQAMGATEIEAIKGEYLRERIESILKEARKSQWLPDDFDTASFHISDTIDANISANLNEQEYEERRSHNAAQLGQKAIQKTLERHNLKPAPAIAARLGEEITRVELDAYRAAYAKMFGDPNWNAPAYASANMANTETLAELFEQYAVSTELPGKTADSWRTYIKRANSYFKGKPAAQLDDQDMRSFAEALRQDSKDTNPAGRALTTKTVNDNYLASLSAVYKWAIEKKKLTNDPTKGVRVKARKVETLPIEGYTREQVAKVLKATRQPQSARTKPETANIRRWVPWLCAFTGARISEILWLKRKDVGFTSGVAYVSIYPDTDGGARSTKNVSSIRHTPLHPAIIEEGFLAYLESLPEGEEYLFPGNWEDKNGDRAKTPANRLRDWLKTKALPNANWERLNPNHSFRHWLTSECRIAKIDGDYARVLTGHRHKDVHGRYGPADTPTLYNELKAIPSPLNPEPHGF